MLPLCSTGAMSRTSPTRPHWLHYTLRKFHLAPAAPNWTVVHTCHVSESSGTISSHQIVQAYLSEARPYRRRSSDFRHLRRHSRVLHVTPPSLQMGPLAWTSLHVHTCPLARLPSEPATCSLKPTQRPSGSRRRQQQRGRATRLQVRVHVVCSSTHCGTAVQSRPDPCACKHLQVVSKDFPRPQLEGTASFTEAAKLSSDLYNAPRPDKPLRIVIAGAGAALPDSCPCSNPH